MCKRDSQLWNNSMARNSLHISNHRATIINCIGLDVVRWLRGRTTQETNHWQDHCRLQRLRLLSSSNGSGGRGGLSRRGANTVGKHHTTHNLMICVPDPDLPSDILNSPTKVSLSVAKLFVSLVSSSGSAWCKIQRAQKNFATISYQIFVGLVSCNNCSTLNFTLAASSLQIVF